MLWRFLSAEGLDEVRWDSSRKVMSDQWWRVGRSGLGRLGALLAGPWLPVRFDGG